MHSVEELGVDVGEGVCLLLGNVEALGLGETELVFCGGVVYACVKLGSTSHVSEVCCGLNGNKLKST